MRPDVRGARRLRARLNMRAFYVVSAPRAAASPRRRGASAVRRAAAMSAILVVRPSSLGDIVHALALVADVRAHRPGARGRLGRRGGVRRRWSRSTPACAASIPVALRRWRRPPLAARPGASSRAFRARRCARERYVAVLDLQEQVKGALIARMARGPRHGPTARASASRSPRCSHDVHHRDRPRDQHFDRPLPAARRRRARLSRSTGRRASASRRRRRRRDAARAALRRRCVHATSRDDKLWPEDALARADRDVRRRGLRVAAALGQRRRARAQRAPRRGHRRGAVVPPRLALPALAGAPRARRRSSSASTPGSSTSPRRWARRRSRCSPRPTPRWPASSAPARTRATSAATARCPRSTTSRAAAGALLRARRAADGARCAPLYTLLWCHRAAAAAAAAVVARPARARLSRAHRRALRPLRAAAAPRSRSSGSTRCRSARRAPRRRWSSALRSAHPAGDDPAHAHDRDRPRGRPRALRRRASCRRGCPTTCRSPCARFLAHFRPRAGLLMETELWPNLVATAARARASRSSSSTRGCPRARRRGYARVRAR